METPVSRLELAILIENIQLKLQRQAPAPESFNEDSGFLVKEFNFLYKNWINYV